MGERFHKVAIDRSGFGPKDMKKTVKTERECLTRETPNLGVKPRTLPQNQPPT
jgi:hypothetical protein